MGGGRQEWPLFKGSVYIYYVKVLHAARMWHGYPFILWVSLPRTPLLFTKEGFWPHRNVAQGQVHPDWTKKLANSLSPSHNEGAARMETTGRQHCAGPGRTPTPVSQGMPDTADNSCWLDFDLWKGLNICVKKEQKKETSVESLEDA